ncbi:hypothetical protein O0L34_g18078 [Tuta absoluta]|nr:hypothetical protein O0L34_g18078 [Tuta absoluta]
MCRFSELHKDSHLPSALLSLLQAQAQSLGALAPLAPLAPTSSLAPLAPPTALASTTPLALAKLPDSLDNLKAHFLQQAFIQNNNTVAQTGDYKPPNKHEEHDSDAEYDDTDDIVLPDETDTFYDSTSNFSGMGSAGNSADGFEVKTENKFKRDSSGSGGDDPSRQFECRHCGKKYRWKSTLRRHENVECGGKAPSHQCPYCAYKAKQRGNLGVHIRKHHNTEWYIYANNKVRRNKKPVD